LVPHCCCIGCHWLLHERAAPPLDPPQPQPLHQTHSPPPQTHAHIPLHSTPSPPPQTHAHTDKCPTPATLADALSGAYLATPKGWQGVALAPTTAAVTVGGGNMKVADVSMVGLQGNVLSKKGLGSPSVTATGGVVTTDSPMQRVNPFNLAGRSMSIGGAGCSLKADGSKVTFSCPAMAMNNNFATEQGSGDVFIKGALTAVGDLFQAKLVSSNDIPSPPQ